MSQDPQAPSGPRDASEHVALIRRAIDAQSGPKSAGSLAATALIAAVIVVLPIGLTAQCCSVEAGLIVFGVGVIGYGLLALVARLLREDRIKVIEHHVQSQANALADGDPGAVQALRAMVWREVQHDALRDLRRRAEQRVALRDPAEALKLTLREQGHTLAVLALCWLLGTVVATFLMTAEGGKSPDMWLCFAYSASAFAVVFSYVLAASSVHDYLTSLQDKRELEREIRHVAGLMDAAGGLSLADDEVESTLRGAISSDAAQGGELSEVEP